MGCPKGWFLSYLTWSLDGNDDIIYISGWWKPWEAVAGAAVGKKKMGVIDQQITVGKRLRQRDMIEHLKAPEAWMRPLEKLRNLKVAIYSGEI